MTALLPYANFDLEQTWDSMTAWLDTTFAHAYTSHRRLTEIDDYLEMLDQELMEFDRSIPYELTPAQLVAAERLGLRLRDIEQVMYAKWRSPLIRRSTLLALRGIHSRYLGPVAANREHDVIFEISSTFHNRDFCGFVQAHRLEMHARWTNSPLFSRRYAVSPVEGPLWVHDLFRHLLGESLRGTSLRNRYIIAADSDGGQADWYKERIGSHFLGETAPKPEGDILETALKLWDPNEERSPYMSLAAAVQAAEIL